MTYDKNVPEDVREVQRYLRFLSNTYPRIVPLSIDGIYGPETEEAVLAFQELFALPPTGEVDADTWDTLLAEYTRLYYPTTRPRPIYPFLAGEPFLQIGDTADEVVLLQMMLNRIARLYQNLHAVAVTGLFDQPTERAVMQAQQVFGFEPVGRLDRRTWDRLAATYNAYVGR